MTIKERMACCQLFTDHDEHYHEEAEETPRGSLLTNGGSEDIEGRSFFYSKGIITSRRIEYACRENIIVKALAEDSEPDHGTIAAFISTNSEAVQGLFAQTVLQCAKCPLIEKCIARRKGKNPARVLIPHCSLLPAP